MSSTILQSLAKPFTKRRPQVRPGFTVKVSERIQEGGKTRTQIFEGLVINVHNGHVETDRTFTVRKLVSGVGVEKIFSLHSPNVENIEIVKVAKVRRAKLFYLRDRQGKAARLSERFTTADEFMTAEEEVEEVVEDVAEETAEITSDDAAGDDSTASDDSTGDDKVEDTNEEKTEADDLTKVEGIGPKIAETLVAAGHSTFAAVAKLDSETIQTLIADVQGSHPSDTWPKQAQMAADGKWDELKKSQDELDGGKE